MDLSELPSYLRLRCPDGGWISYPWLGEIVFAAVLSWIVGFVVIPAPGGLGVREAAVVVAAAALSGGLAAATAIIAGVLFIVVDAIAAAGFGTGAWLRTVRRARGGRPSGGS
jgi:hypothetical protein